MRARMEAASQRRLGRSLALARLDLGGSGGCGLELAALGGLTYQLGRYGLRFVDSPRQADVLLVGGALTRTMRGALDAAWATMAAPKWLVAIGDCAVDGGAFKGSYAVAGGINTILPVDLIVRGCPPRPVEILLGLRALLEANAD
nr:hydrogenase [Endobacter medicaginis]